MIPKELKERIEKFYSDDKKIMYYMKNEDYNNLYLSLYEDIKNSKAIPNSTVLHYLRRKDMGSNLELRMDLNELYKIAQNNIEKINIFMDYEKFFNDDENFV